MYRLGDSNAATLPQVACYLFSVCLSFKLGSSCVGRTSIPSMNVLCQTSRRSSNREGEEKARGAFALGWCSEIAFAPLPETHQLNLVISSATANWTMVMMMMVMNKIGKRLKALQHVQSGHPTVRFEKFYIYATGVRQGGQ